MANYQKLLRENGGFTVDQNGDSPKTGYVVALSKDLEESYLFHDDTAELHILLYLTEHNPAYLGTWVDGDRIYIDSVEVIHDRDEALRLAAERDQLAVYHIDSDEVIYRTMTPDCRGCTTTDHMNPAEQESTCKRCKRDVEGAAGA